MTSTGNSRNTTPTPNTAAVSGPSYASAAGTTKKPASSPLIASGSNPPPVVVGSSAPASHHAKTSSVSPVNGRPSILPAVPAVVHGSNLNGGTGVHSRQGSVTISANGPSMYGTNGGPVGGSRSNIQFGYNSPHAAHSTPQPGTSAPIPIPGGNPRVTSPANSPSPIPQPAASGGRPPSGLQQQGVPVPTFGSLNSDGEHNMRQPPHQVNNAILPAQAGAHIRRESVHSAAGSDIGGQGHNRPNYSHGGRGRAFNPSNPPYSPHNPQSLGYPPSAPYRNNGRGGGGMPPNFQPQPRPISHMTSSPQPSRSPHLPPSNPHTPNIPPATIQPTMPGGHNTPQYHYPAPALSSIPSGMQGYGFPPQAGPQPPYDYQRPVSMAYNYPMHYGPPPQSNSPAYSGQFVPPPPFQPAGPSAMQPAPSQTEKPNIGSGQSGQPLVVSGAPQQQSSQPKPPVVSANFVRPKKSAAITIKNAQGEALDLKSIKGPASPAPSIQQSKTPPVVSSTTTPPQKPSTPTPSRPERTAKDVQDELREKIMQRTRAPQEAKTKDEEPGPEAEEKVEVVAVSETADKVKPAEPAEPLTPAEVSVKPSADAPSAVDTTPKEDVATEAPKEEADDELERIIAEMEAADARREQEQAERSRVIASEKEAAKKKAEEERLVKAAEEDRRLREQEREAERLEEEKEKRRKDNDSGATKSVAELLAQDRSSQNASPERIPDAVKLTDKMATLTITSDSKPSTPTEAASSAATKLGPSEKQRAKPAALNLATLNTKPVEPPQPSAALQSLKSARFLSVMGPGTYPPGIHSPNPAVNAAVTKRGRSFKYDAAFLLQFQTVFTEQPSMEFQSQVKTLIGDNDGSRSASARTPAPGSGRQNSRSGHGSGFVMGNFINAPHQGRTLPPGTTSEQRILISSGQMPRPQITQIGSFRGQAQGGPFPMVRNTSSSNIGNMPGSPGGRVPSGRPNRPPSSRPGKGADKLAAAMPLTENQTVKPIMITDAGWKPTSIGNRAAQNPIAVTSQAGHLDPEMVQRKVKSNLNKMTPENFDKISDHILAIAAQSKNENDGRTLRQVIQLTFEKATDEAHWASMYAKFCKKMLDNISPDVKDDAIKDKTGNVVSGGGLFRKYLLNRCQEDFEAGWKRTRPQESEGETKKSEGDSKKPDADGKKPLEAEMLSDEYYANAAAKRRGLGLVQFIGELYKLGMLTERIMHGCLQQLLDYTSEPDEAEIESLCKLLRTIGGNLDAAERSIKAMDAYFQRIDTVIALPELPSRLKFMLMDVVDLRRTGWQSKEANKGPKTLEEVRLDAEAAAAQKAQEAARSSQRGGPGGRPPMGRGDARAMSSGFGQPASNQVGMDDLRRLQGRTTRTSSHNVTLGPTAMFSSRSNSGRRLAPGSSLGRPGEDSGASSRTGTPPTRETASHSNTFSLLANMESENPASPPSTAASPALSKVKPDTATVTGDKKESD